MDRDTEELYRRCVQKTGGKARLADSLGVDYDTVWAWENFEAEPTDEQIDRMQKLLNA